MPHDVRDQVVDFVRRWSEKTEIGAGRFIHWLGVTASKFYNWRERYGRVNEHNGWVPRDFWLEPWEKEAIIGFHLKNPLEGYRRLTFMMLDADVVAVSPASVWRVLKPAGLLSRWKGKSSRKGTGFEQPLQPHQHWHVDVSYINLSGTFYYLCSVLDGCSRFLVHWDLRESMKEADIEMILERAKEKYPEARPRGPGLRCTNSGEITSRPMHFLSCHLLVAQLPLLARLLQFPIASGMDLGLSHGEHILRCHIAEGAVQSHRVVVINVDLN